MMAVMMVQAQQRPSVQVNNPAVFSEQNPGPIAFNPAAVQEEENFEAPAVQAEEVSDDGSLVRTKRGGHKGGYYRGYYGYRYPYYSYNNGYKT